MNKIILKIVLCRFAVFILFLICFKCSGVNDDRNDSSFGLYFFENKNLSWGSLENNFSRDTLRLTKWMRPETIEAYDYSSHVIYLNNSVNELSVSENYSRPFVAMSHGSRHYYGVVWYVLSENQPVTIRTLPKSDDMVALIWDDPVNPDPRNSLLLERDLQRSGKYFGGLEINLKDIKIIKEDTTFIKYTFDISNLDNSNLFIPEPQDVISIDPNGYVSKLVFENPGNKYQYWTSSIIPIPKKTIEYSTMSQEQFFNLQKNTSRTYSFIQPDFFSSNPTPTLPYGTYKCYYEFYGMMGGTRSKRSFPGGRLYIGCIRSNVVELEYTENRGIVILDYDIFSD